MKVTLKRTDKGVWQFTATAENAGDIQNLKKITEWLYEPEQHPLPHEQQQRP